MAVKQNNTEGNGSGSDANQANGGNGVKSTGTITKSKKMSSAGTNGDGGGGALSTGVNIVSGGTSELPGCSGNTGASSKTKFVSSISNTGSGLANVATGQDDIEQILQFIHCMQQQQLNSSNDIFRIHQIIIMKLALVQPPGKSVEDLKCFKENMTEVSLFLAKSTDQSKFLPYLEFVCQIMSKDERPSYALAVIFQIFNNKIIEAVQSLLNKLNVTDQNIRKTVALLCEWLPICNFCQNLHSWIMAILKGLRKRNKNDLVEQIALENIEQLFRSLVLPMLRPKLAPIVFYMLSSIDENPEMILPRFPGVIKALKEQSRSTADYAENAKEVLQQLFDRSSTYSSKSFDSPAQNAKVGLVNLGNTCYMNSVLQALAMTKEFSREILLSESKSPLLIKMQQQIAFMLYSTRQELTPSKVLNATRPPGFSPGLQQDSSEFLGYLLETLHEQEVAFRKTSSLKTLQNHGEAEVADKQTITVDNSHESGASAICKDDDEEKDERKVGIDDSYCRQEIISDVNSTKSTNLQTIKTATLSSSHCSQSILNKSSVSSNSQISTIEKTFTGRLATTYNCLTCGWKSFNIDSFRDLQLSFPDVKNDCASNYSVQDLIDYYCSSEKLDGDNQYFCERCKKLSDAERYINVISAPKNLILTLKHFKYDQKYHMRAKLMHKVFHDEKVSLKVCSPENLEEIATVHYDLYAGVVHSGFSMDSGHYYTYAADASNKWYKFNDSIVTPSSTEELHNLTPPNTPYILFYQMGARSNDTLETSASTKVIKVDVPTPLTLEELPTELRDMVSGDNLAFNEELRIRRYKNVNSLNANAIKKKDQRRDSFEDDDDEQPPPASGCGGNAMNINMNKFVY